MDILHRTRVFDGVQTRFRHASSTCNAPMTCTVYRPPKDGPVPAVLWLSGLTCTDENFMIKAGAQRVAAELGLALVAPDTSPRDLGLPGEDDDWDLGSGAGFYVNATQAPWSSHYRMFDYVTDELPALVAEAFGLDGRWSVSGHSMGGHGALIAGLKHPDRFRSVSAFAPISRPSACPWGRKAFGAYLGADERAWRDYDAWYLLARASACPPVLVDQGTADEFLAEQLRTDDLREQARRYDRPVEVHLREGYDHSYYFIATFIEAHLRFHAAALAS